MKALSKKTAQKIVFALLPVLVAAGAFFSFSKVTYSDAIELHGYAWSDSAGWISVNCHDNSGNDTNCGYGVTLDTVSGHLSGYGWSDNFGWVLFNPTSPPTYNENIGTGGAMVRSIGGGGIKPVVGWIRFCSSMNAASLPDNCGDSSGSANATNGGWNGWVAMSGAQAGGGATRFGVSYDTAGGQFSGFAWGGTTNAPGSEVVGWVDFSAVTSDVVLPIATIPVIRLTAVSPILPGGTTDINHQLVTAANAADPFVSCIPFTTPVLANGGVTQWDSTSSIYPTNTMAPQYSVYVFAPRTNYYLDCKTQTGHHAADPSNPTVECDINSPATTCPRASVDVLSAIKELTISGRVQGSVGPWLQNFSVNPGDKIELRYTTTNPSAWTSCNGISLPEATLWNSGISETPPAIGSPRTKANVDVPANPTTYNIECSNATQHSVALTPVVVDMNNNQGSVDLEIKLDNNLSSWDTSGVLVPQNEMVKLRWSTSNITPGSCVASSAASIYWSGAIADTNVGVGNIDLDRTAGTTTTYTVTCQNLTGTAVSDTVTAQPIAPDQPDMYVLGPNCVASELVSFTLAVRTTNFGGGTCSLSANPTDTAGLWDLWTGSYAVPANPNPHVHSQNSLHIDQASSPVIFTASCVAPDGTTLVKNHPVLVDSVNCHDNPNPPASWFFRFFER